VIGQGRTGRKQNLPIGSIDSIVQFQRFGHMITCVNKGLQILIQMINAKNVPSADKT
jgi:hypothetical protein